MTSDKAHFTKLPEPIFGGDSIRDRLNDEYLDGCASPSTSLPSDIASS
jgi:hypothetical protein